MSSASSRIARIRPGPLTDADLEPPLSKSDAQRALILADITGAALALPADDELPTDVRVLRAGLATLREASGPVEIDCADGGAPLRFLISQAALPPSRTVRFSGTPRLGERPRSALLGSLASALGPHGFSFQDHLPWPLELQGAQSTGVAGFQVDASESGQFASSLLLAAARLSAREDRPWTLTLTGPLASGGYVDLTVDWLRRAGFTVESDGRSWSVRRQQAPSGFQVPGDWSSLGYLLALAWKTGGRVLRVALDSVHPDREMVEVLRRAGARVEPDGPETLRVQGPLQGPLTASGRHCPDLLPTIAALAVGAGVPALLSDVSFLRAKESDRVAGIQRLVAAAGGTTQLEEDRLRVLPPSVAPREISFDPTGDHRLAMSAAVVACLLGAELSLSSPDCVSKSFPGFWTQLRRLGVSID